jgi:urease accessory protein
MKKVFLLVALASALFAHTNGAGAGSFSQGFMHPFNGIDHILAMVAVGMLAYTTKSINSIVTFVAVMVLSAIIGFMSLAAISVETGIMASIAGIFALVVFSSKVSKISTTLIVAFFAFFHGYAHGAEFLAGSFIQYIAGFSVATIALHVVGLGIMAAYSKVASSKLSVAK